MARKCSTCQHIKRAEIDRRLAAGEPGNQIAADYGLNPSSLHRHRSNCLGLSSSNAIMKEVSRGTAAVACLPSKDELNYSLFRTAGRIDQIVGQAEQEGSLQVALSGSTRSATSLTACRGLLASTGKGRKSTSPFKPMSTSISGRSPSA